MDLPIIELAGTPKAMGQAFGEICRDDIQKLYNIRLQSVIKFAADYQRDISIEQILDIAGACLKPTLAFDPIGYEEFTAIAHAANLSPQQCYVMQGLTDLRDIMAFGDPPDGEGCSSLILGADRTNTGAMLLAQSWDLQTNNMPFVRLVHRKPTHAPQTISLTLTGCLTLIGINEHGIAVGNTNLKTTDSRIGVQYLSVLHRALRCSTLDDAVQVITQAPRASGHYYYVGSPDGKAVGIECSATRYVLNQVTDGHYVHCNHALSPQIAHYKANDPTTTTIHRQSRLSQLIDEHPTTIGVEDIKSFLSDHEGGDDRCLCRHGHNNISTNATVILSPSTREIHACRGQPHTSQWLTKKIDSR